MGQNQTRSVLDQANRQFLLARQAQRDRKRDVYVNHLNQAKKLFSSIQQADPKYKAAQSSIKKLNRMLAFGLPAAAPSPKPELAKPGPSGIKGILDKIVKVLTD